MSEIDWQAMDRPLDAKLGLELIEVTAERTIGRMPVEGNTQPMGIWHGGASALLAETVGSCAAYAHAVTVGKVPVGMELNVSHHRAVRSGSVTGTATALSLGRTVAAYQIDLTDDAGRRIATARLTCQLIEDNR